MEKIEYATLKYYNSCVSEECLNVGMLFNNVTHNYTTFIPIKNFKRLATFDDDINIDFFKSYLQSIKDEVEGNVFNYKNQFNMKDYIKPYVNELRFSNVITEITDDNMFIDSICKLFLKYDYNKDERLSNENEKNILDQF